MQISDALNYFSKGHLFKKNRDLPGEALVEDLLKSSAGSALIKEAQKSLSKHRLGKLKVCIEPTKSGFTAEQDFNVIRISPSLSKPRQRSSLLFELTNVIQHHKHLEIWNLARKGMYKNAEEYARAKEHVEFNGLKRRNIVCRAISQEKGNAYLKNSWERCPLENMDFEYFYSTHLVDNHKEYYRREWRKFNNAHIFENAVKVVTVSSLIATFGWFR